MSELREDLLAPTITKKNIIGVIIVAGLLISFFTYSAYLYSLIFESQRINPSEKVEDAEYDEYLLVLPPLPDEFKDLLDDLDLDDLDLDDLNDLKDLGIDIDDIDQADLDKLAQLVDEEDIADFLEEMNDGDIDNYDLTNAGLIIAALLFSDVEVFRVYEYDNPIDEREDIIWKYECFDKFNGDGWESTAPKLEHSFPDLDDYWSTYSYLDKIRLKRKLLTSLGVNSFVMGALFPEPLIIEETIAADNLHPDPELSQLYKDEMGCVIADLSFTSAENVSMTYELFGLNLPTNEDINNTAVRATYTPNVIKNQYLQLPPDIGTYKTNNPSFNSHWNVLNTIINASDNAFMVANKIRNYLQSNFELSFDELINDPPAEGEDVVEWFCEKGEGLYSEFASAFCAFTRSFGVTSRFVDGYNSRLIEQFFDTEELLDTYAIKYKNIYDWAEIYVPWDTSGLLGHGKWVQMDILYDSFGEGGNPITEARYNLTVTSNATQPFLTYERGNIANITAILNSTTYSVNGELITFEDITTEQILGSDTTDINGIASIEVNITSFKVGPHVIKASQATVENWTYFIINGNVNVNLTQVLPQEVNVSVTPHQTTVQGFVEDAVTHEKLDNVELNFLLLYKGTNNPVTNPFDPMETYTDDFGNFDLSLEVKDYINYGEYDFRVDFNGTWAIPIYPYQIIFSNINDSSATLDFNVTKELTYDLFFSINGRPTEYPSHPNPNTLINAIRYEQLNLTTTVINEDDGSKASGQIVEFYDYTNGHVIIGTDISDSNGNASILYTIGNTNKSGPTLVYAKIGNVINYSYYIVNESIGIDIISYSDPLEIDLAGVGPTQFNIQCRLLDNRDNPIDFSQIDLTMNRSIFDYTGYLTPSNPVFPTPAGSNMFDFDRSVLSTTPVNNYTLKVEFGGYFDFYNYPYSATFNLAYLSNSTEIAKQLKVYDSDDVEILLSVEGNLTKTLYDNIDKPEIYARGDIAHFNVTVFHMGGPPGGGTNVTIWDDYTNKLLDIHYFNGFSGYVQFNISTNKFYFAGIHKIKVQFGDYPAINTTFIIINETVNVNAISTIQTTGIDNVVLRDNGGFTITGYIMENGTGLRGLRVRVLLLNSTSNNLSHFLIGNPFAITNSNGNFTIQINSIDINCPHGEYYIRVDFNGSINLQEVPGINLINNYMINDSSSLVPLNITAGTKLIDSYYFRVGGDQWEEGSPLYVYGNLSWDNNIRIQGMSMNATIRASNGTILDTHISAPTDINGFFNITFAVGQWLEDTEIWMFFKPIDNFEPPEFYYIEPIQQKLDREP